MEVNKNNNVFTQEVKLLTKKQYFLQSLGNGCLKLVLWIVDFILSIFLSLGHFFLVVGKGIYKGALAIFNFFKHKVHQFKYNDKYGRISFGLFGLASIKNGQIVNGILYMVFEVAYIVLFVLFGIPAIGKLNLPQTGMEEVLVCDELGMCWSENRVTGNSILFLIFGLLWVLSILIFFYIWNRSINAGYTLYRMRNFVAFDTYTKNTKEFSEHISTLAVEAYDNGVKKSEFIATNKEEIYAYFDSVNLRVAEEMANGNARTPFEVDFTIDLVKETISHAYTYARQRRALQKKIDKAIAKKNEYNEVRATKLAKVLANTNDEITISKFKNRTLSGLAKRDLAISKASKKLADYQKQYACVAEIENTKNNDKYGKYNFYFKNIARIDNHLLFWNHYDEFVNVYRKSLTLSDQANEKNANLGSELDASTKAKLSAIAAKYASIRQRRLDVEAEIVHARHVYNEKVLEIKARKGSEAELLEAKAVLVEESTKWNNVLNDLPSPQNVKEMEKEEIRETKHAYRRDRKYLKTNFTPESYARQCVIDHMLLEYKIEYKDAVMFTNILYRTETGAEINDKDERIAMLETEKTEFKAAHMDKFVAKAPTFIEQIKALLNENFHITILFLPLLGIVLFTIVPLIFSILIAFTDYSKGHIPPTEWFTWIGLENFFTIFSPSEASLFKDLPNALGLTLGWTLIWAVCATFSNYFLGIIIALMINKNGIKFKKLWRTIFVLTIAVPQFISLLSIATLIKDTGAIGQLWLDMFGSKLGFATSDNVLGTKIIIILVNIWVGIPYTILSTTGILLNIPKDLYESSTVDGAGTLTQFTKITMPYIFFVTGPYLITQFVGNINNFNVIFFLTGGEPILSGSSLQVGQTDLLITFLYDLITSANNPQFGIASAIGIIIFIICSLFSIVMYNKSGSIQEEDQFQ